MSPSAPAPAAPRSLARRFAAATVLLVAVVLGGAGVVTFVRGARRIEDEYRERVLVAARTAAALVDPAGFDGAAVSGGNQASRVLRGIADGSSLPGLRLSVWQRADGGFVERAGHPATGESGSSAPVRLPAVELAAALERVASSAQEETLHAPLPDGGEGVSGLSPAPGGIVVVAQVAAAGSRAEVRRFVVVLLLELAVAAVIAMVASRALGRKLAQPLRELALVADGLADGEADLTQRLPVGPADEIGRLELSFNRFLGSLAEVVSGIRRSAAEARRGAAAIAGGMAEGRAGAERQLAAVRGVEAAIGTVSDGSRGIETAVGDLSSKSRDAASLVLELDASIHEAADELSRLEGLVRDTGSAIGRSASATGSIEEMAREFASAAEDTAAAMAELDAAARSIETIANETAALADRASVAAARGRDAVASTGEGMATIADETRKVSDTISGLERRTREIGDILGVIGTVADQTNLLALNAAIIAAQAGDRGRGFDVVAEEIRELAERTAASTKEIADVIEAVQREASSAVEVVDRSVEAVQRGRRLAGEAGSALEQILAGTTDASDRVAQIARATREQSQTSQSVTMAMDRISGLLGRISSATRAQSESAAATERAIGEIREIAARSAHSSSNQAGGTAEVARLISSIGDRAASIEAAARLQRASLDESRRLAAEIESIATRHLGKMEELARAAKELDARTGELEGGFARFRVS